MKIAIVIILAVMLALAAAWMLPSGMATDFDIFYNAGMAVRAGQSPYTVPDFYSPAWLAVLFAPLSALPREIAYRLYAAVTMLGFPYALWRLSGRQSAATLIACSLTPFTLIMMRLGNVDWLVLLGAALPAPIGLWLVLLKPQMGIALAALWLWQSLQERGIRYTALTFAPVTLALVGSVLAGMRAPDLALLDQWSTDIWPLGLVVGVPAALWALRSRDSALALAATPFLSPYVGPMSWAGVLPLTMRRHGMLACAILLSWAMLLIWVFEIV